MDYGDPILNHRGSIVNTTVVQYKFAMSREDPQIKLRLPAELKERIEAAATANGRSMNSEVVARLVASFELQIAPRMSREMLVVLSNMVEGIVESRLAGKRPEVLRYGEEALPETYWTKPALAARRLEQDRQFEEIVAKEQARHGNTPEGRNYLEVQEMLGKGRMPTREKLDAANEYIARFYSIPKDFK